MDEGVATLGNFYKALGWEREFESWDNITNDDAFYNVPEEKQQVANNNRDQANAEIIKNVDKAIESLDEDNFSEWFCHLSLMKAERLHWMGNKVEAVRLAIQSMPEACDEDERAWAKSIISGIPKDSNYPWPMPAHGYGFGGKSIEERIQLTKENNKYEYDNDLSPEDNEDMEKFCEELTEEAINDILHGESTFTNRPYHERQFIFTVCDLDHIGGCYDETDTIKYVLPLTELPGEILFPLGHPQANTLYYAHPLRRMYIPFETAQTALFHEKVQEICRLFQCLGAVEITTRCIKGEKISSTSMVSNERDVTAQHKRFGTSGNVGSSAYSAESNTCKNEMSLTQSFSPTKVPYCPDDLLWTKEDQEIQTFIRQRLEGGLLQFTKRVSSYETSNITSSQIMNVKAAFNTLMSNISTSCSQSSDTTFNSINETEWEISVIFKPIEELKNNAAPNVQPQSISQEMPSTGLPENEEAYREELLFFLENGEISEKERRLLDRKRIKLGISEERAIEIEKSLSGRLTPEEEQYKEEVMFCLEDDGYIDEQERKLLERKRIKFGIAPERAAEIEEMCQPQLTEDEQEYIETYRDLLSDGRDISERERRILERQRKSLGISEKRANELENMI